MKEAVCVQRAKNHCVLSLISIQRMEKVIGVFCNDYVDIDTKLMTGGSRNG